MPFGEIFTGTFSHMWRHKRLWLFGLLGLAPMSIGLGIFQLFQVRWQRQWMDLMGRLTEAPGGVPSHFMADLMSAMTWLWAGAGVWMMMAFFGYVLNVIMRGATMSEAAIAWAGDGTQTGRGISVGAVRAVYVFVIDLLWFLPGILVGCGGVGALIVVLGMAGNMRNSDEAAGAFVLTLLVSLCCLLCLSFVVGLLSAVFSPLMYQSAVAGRRSLGAAIREGWRLAQANLGAMIIFALLLWIFGIGVSILVSALTLPFAIPWMTDWMKDWTSVMEDASRGVAPTLPQFRGGGWLIVAGLVSTLLTWLTSSFIQSFRLTLYAEVYRRLSGQGIPAAPDNLLVAPPEGTSATSEALAGLSDISVADDPVDDLSSESAPHV